MNYKPPALCYNKPNLGLVFKDTMGLVTPAQSNPGETIEASDINTPVNQLAAVINGAIETANLADGAVTPAKLSSGAGASWSYQSWTPTWANFTTGNGTLNYAKYIQIGKTIHFRLKFTLGSTSSMSTGPTFSLPVAINGDLTTTTDLIQASVGLVDTGTAFFSGVLRWATSSTVGLYALNAAGTYAGTAQVSSTVPHTWANTDVIEVSGTYDIA